MGVEAGVDANGGEIRIETGTGIIVQFDEVAGKRNAQVEIKATHTQLRHPVKAWADMQDSILATALRDAADARGEIEYRIEVHRRHGIGPETPLAKLANNEKVRDLVRIGQASGRSETQESAPSAPETAPRPKPAPETQRPPEAPAPASAVRRGIRVEEARPWERLNSDGSINLGSYEAQATTGIASLAYDLLLERARQVAQGGPVQAPSSIAVKALGTYLLTAADAAQAAVRADGMADRMDASHSRARGAIREALNAYPVPWGASKAENETWRDTLAATAAMLLTVGVELMEVELGSLAQVKAGEEKPAPPAYLEGGYPANEAAEEELEAARIEAGGHGTPLKIPVEEDEHGEPLVRNSQEADVVEEARARGADPTEALRRARAASQTRSASPA